MSRRRASATRDPSITFEEEGDQKEKRRAKAMQQLVHLGMSRLDDAAASDARRAGPFKPGQIADACFEVAPDGKYKGMKFRKPELMQALRAMSMPSDVELEKSNKEGAREAGFGEDSCASSPGDGGEGGEGEGGEHLHQQWQRRRQQRIFSVASSKKSGQQRYSSYPIDISSLPTTSRRADRSDREAAYGPNPDVVCGITIPPQRVLWPTWPDQRAVDLQKAISERKAEDDAEREKERAKKGLEKPERRAAGSGQVPSRRSTRETVSTVVWVDGHRVLKANNYTLEDGESSVWDSEVEKPIPPPKKPATAYMLFCSKFRQDHKGKGESDGGGLRKRGKKDGDGGGRDNDIGVYPGGGGGGGNGGDDDDDDDDYEKNLGSGCMKRKAKKEVRANYGKLGLMDQMVATWRSLSNEESAVFTQDATRLKEVYEKEVDAWKLAIQGQEGKRQARMRALRAIPTEQESIALALVDSIDISSASTARVVPSSSVSLVGDGVDCTGEGTDSGVGIAAVDDTPFSPSSSASSSSSSSSSPSSLTSSMESVATLPPRRSSSILPPEAASSRSLVNWSEEVVFVLQKDPSVPGGLNFESIQKRLAVRGHNRKWFELRAPLKTLLKRGITRRTLVTLETDGDFLEGIRARWEVEKERRRQENEVVELGRIERELMEMERLREEKEIAEKQRIERGREAEQAKARVEAVVENSQMRFMLRERSGAEDMQALGGPERIESSLNSSSSSILVLEPVSYGGILEASDTVASGVGGVEFRSYVETASQSTAAAAPSVQQEVTEGAGASSHSALPLSAINTSSEESEGAVLAADAKAETISVGLKNGAPMVMSSAAGTTMLSKEVAKYQGVKGRGSLGLSVESKSSDTTQGPGLVDASADGSATGSNTASSSFSSSSSCSASSTSSFPVVLPSPASSSIAMVAVSAAGAALSPSRQGLRERPERKKSVRELKQRKRQREEEAVQVAMARARAAEEAEEKRRPGKVGERADYAPTERDVEVVELEATLRRYVMEAVKGLTFLQAQIDTSTFPEDAAVEQTEVAEFTAKLEAESVLSLSKLKAALSEKHCNHDVRTFDQPADWKYTKKGRHWAHTNLANSAQFFQRREDVEKELENAARRKGRAFLGRLNPLKGTWDISSQALPVAVAYLVGGLAQSRHLIVMVHNSTEAILPANLYVAGPPFPTGGKGKQEVARKQHNTKMAFAAARARLSSMKYVASQIAVVRPFLDPEHAATMLEKVGLSDATAQEAARHAAERSAAAVEKAARAIAASITKDGADKEGGSLMEVSDSTALASASEPPGKKKKLTHAALAAAAEAKAAKEELERQVDLSTLPVMTMPAPSLPQPASIQGTMRSYQLEGLSWLVHGFQHGMNGILADEMGLGKTLQTISFLSHITLDAAPDQRAGGPHLVVVPLSVLTSWVLEFRRFCPALRVVRLHSGDEKERERLRRDVLADVSGYDVVVTTYDMVVGSNMKHCLTRQWWRCMILDEGHKIKNEETDVSEACRRIRCVHRVLLTGTPMQNNLHELWAMLNFLLPDVFVTSEPFDNCFDLTRGKVDKDMLDRAHHLMQLFSLRRLKSDVEVSLPPKHELKISVPLSEFQMHFYRALLMKDVSLLQKATQDQAASATWASSSPSPSSSSSSSSSADGDANRGAMVATDVANGLADQNSEESSEWKRLQSLMMQLRKCCDHPYLFSGADPNPESIDEGIITSSNKMVLLDRLLPKLKAKGHRVLIFSQFTSMLDILDDYCRYRGFEHARLDGSTNRVQRAIDVRRFNQNQSSLFIFLMSTRAGGLGINLQTSDTVILYDSDWNPQVDLQAIGRAHRIGQTKTVHVYRLITEGAVEERIYDRAQKKLFLSEMVNRDSTGPAEELDRLGKKELLQMLSFGADQIFQNQGKLPTDAEIDTIIDRSEKSKVVTATTVPCKTGGDATKAVPERASPRSTRAVSSSDSFSSSLDVLQSGTHNADDFDAAVQSVSIRNFQGIEYAVKKVKVLQSTEDIAAAFHVERAKREGKSRFVEVDGFKVLKLNNYEVTGSTYKFEGVENGGGGMGGGKKMTKRTTKRQVAGRDYRHESTCLLCWDGGSMILCDRCPAAFHGACLGLSPGQVKGLGSTQWSCPHHQCVECGRKAQAVGGLIFRCECCPMAYCEDHLPIDAELVGHCKRFEDLGMRHPDQACYIHHNADCHKWAEAYVYKQAPPPSGGGSSSSSSSSVKKKSANGQKLGGEKRLKP